MRLGTAIEKLVENYNYAVGKEWVQDKVAWALYHTWKEADEHRAKQTEPQTRTDEDGRVWDYRNGNWWQLGKTENSSEKPNNCEDLQDWKDRMWAEAVVTEPQTDMAEDIVRSFGFKTESYRQAKAKTEQTERSE